MAFSNLTLRRSATSPPVAMASATGTLAPTDAIGFRTRLALASERPAVPEPRPPVWRMMAELEYMAEPVRRRFRKIDVPRAAHPRTVMILPGFATTPWRMRYLAVQLERAGHTVRRWGLGTNWGPTPENVSFLEGRLATLSELSGDKVSLVGWSLGGLFARELARRRPANVAKVITMGTPFSGSPRANNAWRAYQFVTGHSVDAPPITGDVAIKPPVPTVALWSPRDGIIAPRAACGRQGERDRAIALRCTHMGFSFSREAIETLAAELDAP
ncbi:esterase/lipase family protein [Alteripontixanthobacter maritimus]|nr:alpha/beta fold hydrolase [Alteripontixanthobacter maritimus]